MSAGGPRYRWGPACYLAAIVGVPTFVAFGPVFAAPPGLLRLTAVAVAPMLFSVSMPLVAGLLARLTIDAVVAGTFCRDLSDPKSARHHLYDVCWTALYCCGPIYHVVVTLPWLKRATLRLFGYRGSLDVTLYADTWIRDLPLLELGSGSCLASKATVATSVCLPAGKIVVAPVCIGRHAVVGHLAMLGPGVVLGDDVEIRVGASIGPHAQIGSRSTVGPNAAIHHGVRIGADCHVGAASHIGAMAMIADGLTIPFGTVIPPRACVRTARDLDNLRTILRADACCSSGSPARLPQLSLVTGGEG